MNGKKRDWESVIMGFLGICAGMALLAFAAGFVTITIIMIRDMW